MKPISRDPDTVIATEIAAWVYCPEQSRLEHALDLRAANRPQRDAGIEHHERKADVERLAGGSIALGRILIVAALVALSALAVLWAFRR